LFLFSIREDAEKAKSEITSIDGRKLLIHFATKKPKTKNKRKRVPLDEDDSESEDKPAEKGNLFSCLDCVICFQKQVWCWNFLNIQHMLTHQSLMLHG
jgi:hypothetical protein